jgi:hypothetical protein
MTSFQSTRLWRVHLYCMQCPAAHGLQALVLNAVRVVLLATAVGHACGMVHGAGQGCSCGHRLWVSAGAGGDHCSTPFAAAG